MARIEDVDLRAVVQQGSHHPYVALARGQVQRRLRGLVLVHPKRPRAPHVRICSGELQHRSHPGRRAFEDRGLQRRVPAVFARRKPLVDVEVPQPAAPEEDDQLLHLGVGNEVHQLGLLCIDHRPRHEQRDACTLAIGRGLEARTLEGHYRSASRTESTQDALNA